MNCNLIVYQKLFQKKIPYNFIILIILLDYFVKYTLGFAKMNNHKIKEF